MLERKGARRTLGGERAVPAGVLKVAFAGGGTGGHIYPGLAVIEALKAEAARAGRQVEVFWIGAESGMDRSLVEAAGVPFRGIRAGKLRRYFSLRNFTDIFRVLAGFLQARGILRQERPALLFSKGGFASVPPAAAAASLGIPVFTHESDVSPGLATRINALFATRIFTAYERTAAFFALPERRKVSVVGNPVRAAFFAASEAERTAAAARGRVFLGVGEDEQILLVLGGSQGALEVNRLVAESLPSLTARFVVVHQRGAERDGESAPPASERYRPYAYIGKEMPEVLSAAALVLGRSGAGTVWEAAACGKPMVLIPLTGSGTRGDQVENARFFADAGAALTLVSPSPQALSETIAALADNPARLAAMSAASRAAGSSNAARSLAGIILGTRCKT